jgi:DNA-binding CsgD family transcriptional regulator/tetratricopeptide (TPR) repeat protein
MVVAALEEGRAAFARQEWGTAFERLSTADRASPLALADLELLGNAAYLTGRTEECDALSVRVHHECLRLDDPCGAARCAFWLGLSLLLRGEVAQARGWLARAHGLVDDLDCPERGYLLVMDGFQQVAAGDPEAAYTSYARAAEIGEQFSDHDLLAFGRLGRGEARIALGDAASGLVLLDEAMVAVTAGEVSPMVAGIMYCAALEACFGVSDLARATEWTAALDAWCEAQTDLVPYRGQCLVHRAEIMQLHGSWPDALDAAEQAGDWLTRPPHPALGLAYYLQGELHRLQGRFVQADAAYRQANRAGVDPTPGVALLRLATGEVSEAVAAIRRVVDEQQNRVLHAKALLAFVEIMLASGDLPAARRGAERLAAVAANLDVPFLHAAVAHSRGAIQLADGATGPALAQLRQAWSIWRSLDAPYEAARERVLIGLGYRALHDEVGAEMELDAARSAFEQLGAAPDLARVLALSERVEVETPGGLTAREVEVLRLVAAGETNREIGSSLTISEHTVARHLQNIFSKLGVSSRAAATAYAYEHGLV